MSCDCISLPNAAELVEQLRSETHFVFGDYEGGFALPTQKELKAADAIEQLVSKCNHLAEENAKLKAERDAAVEDIAEMLWLDGNCDYCLYAEKDMYKGANKTKCGLGTQCYPEWRGIKEEEYATD